MEEKKKDEQLTDEELKEIEEFVEKFGEWFNLPRKNPEEWIRRYENFRKAVKRIDLAEAYALSRAMTIWVR